MATDLARHKYFCGRWTYSKVNGLCVKTRNSIVRSAFKIMSIFVFCWDVLTNSCWPVENDLFKVIRIYWILVITVFLPIFPLDVGAYTWLWRLLTIFLFLMNSNAFFYIFWLCVYLIFESIIAFAMWSYVKYLYSYDVLSFKLAAWTGP